jgi:hypothetical protein
VPHLLWHGTSVNFPTYKILALLENFVDRPESLDSFSAKSCVFLTHGLGYISPFQYTTWPKQGIKKFLRHLLTTLVSSLTLQSMTSLCHLI